MGDFGKTRRGGARDRRWKGGEMEGGTHTHTHSKEQTHTDTQTHTLLHIVRSASVRLRGGYGGSAKKKSVPIG